MVYGVFGGCYSDWFVVGYFEKKDDAEEYCKEHNDKCEYDWDEYYVRPILNLADNDPNIYRLYVYNDVNGSVWGEIGEFSEKKKRTRIIGGGDNCLWVKVWLLPCDFSEERVRKIGRDEIAKYKAQKAGIV